MSDRSRPRDILETASTSTSSVTNFTQRVILTTTLSAAAATVVNVALWGIGRAANASFIVDPAIGHPLQVGVVKVVLTTLLPFAVGTVLLLLAARRSRRWVARLAIMAGVLALASAAGPLAGGYDTATRVLLATMHVTTGAAFVAAAAWVRLYCR